MISDSDPLPIEEVDTKKRTLIPGVIRCTTTQAILDENIAHTQIKFIWTNRQQHLEVRVTFTTPPTMNIYPVGTHTFKHITL